MSKETASLFFPMRNVQHPTCSHAQLLVLTVGEYVGLKQRQRHAVKRESTDRTNLKHTQTAVPEPVELEKVEDKQVSHHKC